ncbi:hypothetical protein PG991_001495 [Apiospora marii]|uniref:Uncharacterized protein n=1 Tax=Apiospora marii TaxID=335849 RepID=A0ABR1SPU8_9PEZI
MSGSGNTNDNDNANNDDGGPGKRSQMSLSLDSIIAAGKKKRRGAVKRRWNEELGNGGSSQAEGAKRPMVESVRASSAVKYKGRTFVDIPEKPRQRPDQLAWQLRQAQQAMAASGYRFDGPDADCNRVVYAVDDQGFPIVPSLEGGRKQRSCPYQGGRKGRIGPAHGGALVPQEVRQRTKQRRVGR